MSEKKRDTLATSNRIGSDLKRVDAYVLGPKDYEDISELTDEWFRRADIYHDGKLVRRGRPPSAVRKRAVSLRLDPDVLAHFRRSGRGWQSRINAVLRRAAKLPEKKQSKM